MYDKFQTLAMRSSVAVSILANSDVSDIELLPVAPRAYSDEEIHRLAAQWAGRGLGFIGVVGIVDGVPQTALDVPLDPGRIEALSAAFVAYCESLFGAYIREQTTEPEYDWHAQKYRLVPRRALD